MSLETAIQNLADAINKLASAPPINVEEEPQHEKEATVAPTSKKKAGKKKTAKTKAKAEPKAELDPTYVDPALTEKVVEEETLSAEHVQAHLRGIASQITDTSQLFALIQKHGGTQFSDLDPSVYAVLIEEAEALLPESDPLQ